MLEPNTEAIIRLVWARRLGLADDALADDLATRLTVPTADADDWGVVRLWRTTVLVAPPAMLTALDRVGDDDLFDPALLRAASGSPQGRLPTLQRLVYADAYPGPTRRIAERPPLVSREASDAARLVAGCPPDDAIGLDLDRLDAVFTLLDDSEQRTGGGPPHAVAVSGYTETSGLLARLRVLVPPPARRSGYGAVAASIAIEDALDQGMILESWVEDGQTAAVRLSESVPMSRTGCRIWSPKV